MALTDGLISYWKCDEVSGNALDAHGSNALSGVNAPGSATGIINNGRDLESGSAQYFTHADNADLSLGSDTDFTWAFWFKSETGSTNKGLITKAKTSVVGFDDYAYRIVDDGGGSGKTTFLVGNDVSYAQVTSNTFTYLDGQWYYVIAWHDSALNKIYIQVKNDTPAETAWSGGTFDDNGALYVGSLDSGVTPFDGVLDEIGFWKRVLTSTERDALWNFGAGLTYPFGAVTVARPDYYYRSMRAA